MKKQSLLIIVLCMFMVGADASQTNDIDRVWSKYERDMQVARKFYEAAKDRATSRAASALELQKSTAMRRGDIDTANAADAALAQLRIESFNAPDDMLGHWMRVTEPSVEAIYEFHDSGRATSEESGWNRWRRVGDELVMHNKARFKPTLLKAWVRMEDDHPQLMIYLPPEH